MSTTCVHIAAYPYPASGHIIPMLDLTHLLLTRGLTVTIFVTPSNIPLLQPLFSGHPSSLHHFVLPELDIKLPPLTWLFVKARALRELHFPILLEWFRSHSSPLVAIISDFFFGWTNDLALELCVPRVVFSPSGAFGLSFSFSLWRDPPKNDDPEDMNSQFKFPKLPCSPTYPWWQIPEHHRSLKGDPDVEFFRENIMVANMMSWGLIFNSFAGLEGVYLEHLKREVGHDRVWAVGPVLPPDHHGAQQESIVRGGVSSVPCHQVMTWLDSRPDDSVVYVCFGSRTVLRRTEMDLLTSALEQSGVGFVFCVRVSSMQDNEPRESANDGVIPNGFEDRVRGRGFVIRGWAPQVSILRHRAVGAFLSHCGWNSLLEGIVAGVVMLTWPMDGDQFTNAKLLEEQFGVAIRTGEGTQIVPQSEELARLLVASVDGSRPERARAKKLSNEALGAVLKGGSSYEDLGELVKLLSDLQK
ncbi:hypothetical protein I3842_15G122900 [Carya illinoinensis]|uniref:Uncharacterized protein n=1 Tax=Carya illinoinensis TaxID=32201 RepID=A0A922ACY1_CARIL|nr:hypothetical protein I3842_15G122900 [Carya illinoinensis]